MELYLGRYPEHGLSISILCNGGDSANRTLYAQNIFGMFVPTVPAPDPESGAPPANTGEALADVNARAGLFFNERTGEPLRLAVDRDRFRVAGGPYTVPVSINNASRLSMMTLTVTYNPSVLRVRTTQDGTFMRQGSVATSFTPRIDAATGRVDIAITRTADQAGASGSGLLAALVFDAIGPGGSMIQVSGVASTP